MNGNLLKDHFMLGPLSTDYFLSFYVGNLMWYIQKLGEGNGNPLQCSCLEIPGMGGSLVGCCLWGRTESDTTEATWQQHSETSRSPSLSLTWSVKTIVDFPGGSMVKDLPANAEGHGFNPWSRKIQHTVEQLSLCTTETMLWNKRSHHNEKTECCN